MYVITVGRRRLMLFKVDCVVWALGVWVALFVRVPCVMYSSNLKLFPPTACTLNQHSALLLVRA